MELKNIQTFEQHTDKNLNISDVIKRLSDKKLYSLNDMIECFQKGSNDTFKNRERIIELLIHYRLIKDENDNVL